MKPAAAPTRTLFERAYVAAGYLLGARGEQLTRGFLGRSHVEMLCAKLAHSDQSRRAQALAGELTPLARTLLRQRLR